MFPQARIYAIEPDEGNLAVQRRNISGCPNVITLAGAVWDRPTKLRIGNPEAGAGAYRVLEGTGELRAYTISDLVGNVDDEHFIVKIDIEGGEQALFRSNIRWLGTARLAVLELHDWLYPVKGQAGTFYVGYANIKLTLCFEG